MGRGRFTKSDLLQTYQHLVLINPESRNLLTINTHKTLHFGVHSTFGIFQKELENRVAHILFVKYGCSNDILISGKNEKEHLENLRQLLHIIQENGLNSENMYLWQTKPFIRI